MPYIKQDDRQFHDEHIERLSSAITNVGDLNYCITRLIMKFLLSKGLKYENINAVSGVLQKIQQEFDDRVARPYENLKIKQNGDVPEYRQAALLIAGGAYGVPPGLAPER
jgi:hypothetical protein